MRSFVPDGSQIDPRWYSEWGERFGIPDLAADMARNPRLADRLALSVYDTMQIDVRARFSEDEIVSVAQFIDDRARLIAVCGLVVNGEMIRSQVSKSDYETLTKAFNTEDLKIAVSLPHLHDGKSVFGIDINKLPELVSRSGNACVEAWISGLSDQMKRRLQLLGTETESTVASEQMVKRSSEIVLAVSRRLCGLPDSQAA